MNNRRGPLINPGAVNAYLARALDDCEQVKTFSDKELVRAVRALEPEPEFVTDPYRHQLACFFLAAKCGSVALFLDMGLGKTKIALDSFSWRKDAKQAERALVLVPGASNVAGWEDEVGVHAPHLRVYGFDASRGRLEDQKEIAAKHDVIVCTYAGWQALVCGSAGKRVPPKALTSFERLFEFVIYDESTALKNPKSLTFRLARRLRKNRPYVLAMTGTPLDKNPIDLWAQLYAVDGGETLGRTLGLYRAGFFRAVPRRWGGGFDYEFQERKKKKLARTLRHRSVRYAAAECLDLPELVRVRRSVIFSESTWAYQARLADDLKKSKGNYELVENVYLRMRSLTSGWLKITTEDSEDVIEFEENPKIDALLQLIREIPDDEKIVIFNVFHRSGDLIERALASEKISAARLYGKTSDAQKVVRAFQKNKNLRVLLASKSGALGLNLQVARHAIFFESFDSAIDRQQAEKRVHRVGQAKTTFIYDLVVRASVDERVLSSVEAGRNLLADLVDGKEKL